MFAASLLVVAVMATYAGLAAISLTAGGSFSLPSFPATVFNGAKRVIWNPPPSKKVLRATSPVQGQIKPFGDVQFFDIGTASGSSMQQFSLTNTSTATLPLSLTVNATPGISAQFGSGGLQTVVRPRKAATINVTTDPMHAGPIGGTLTVAITNSRGAAYAAPYTIKLTGAQAPLPVASLTATPAAHGAIHVAWSPSPSSGVTGYLLQRGNVAANAAPTTVATLPATATSATDQTPADGTYAYQVIAVAPGSSDAAGPVTSGPSPLATAVADTTAPGAPQDMTLPPFINRATVQGPDALTFNVTPAVDAEPTDTITVTLTDQNGKAISGSAPATGSPVPVTVSGVDKLADGQIQVKAAETDSAGNTGNPFTSPPLPKDVMPPAVPTVSVPQIVADNVAQVPVTVTTDAAGERVNVTMKDAAGNIAMGSDTETAGETSITIDVNAKTLDDTTDGDPVMVTATATDQVGNASDPGSTSTTKHATPPALPDSIDVLGGPNNPPNVVTAQSQSAVTVQATFAAPPSPDDHYVIHIAHVRYPVTADGQSTTLTVGPLDLTSLADGTYTMGIREVDPYGNVSSQWSWHFVKDTGGAEAPTSVGVPAGPDNPAGYVNAATQTAATIVATFAGPTDPADQISLTVGGMPLPAQSGGSDQISWTADLSDLPDGTLPIEGQIVDPNGVTSTFSGSLIKDTQAPPAPAVAYVVGPPPNTITPSKASCVKVLVAFNQAPDPNDSVTVTLSDGSSSAEGSATAGDGHVVVGCIDASSLSAGSISVNVTVTDVAGNTTDFTGNPATLLDCHHGGQGNDGGQSPDQ